MECWALVTTYALFGELPGLLPLPPPISRAHPNQDGGGNMKIIGELKPESLTHDSSAGICAYGRRSLKATMQLKTCTCTA